MWKPHFTSRLKDQGKIVDAPRKTKNIIEQIQIACSFQMIGSVWRQLFCGSRSALCHSVDSNGGYVRNFQTNLEQASTHINPLSWKASYILLHAVYAVFCSNLYNVDKTWEWMLWHALTFPRTWSVSTVDMQWLLCAKMVRWSPGDTVHMAETAEMSRLDLVQTILSVLHDSYMTLTCLPDLTVPCQFCCGHETMVKQCTHPDQTSMSQFRTYILKTVYKLYHFI